MGTRRSSDWVLLDYDQGTGEVRVAPDDLRPGDLQISASQLGTFKLCPRKWWFEKVAKLPRQPKPQFDYGTTLHECCERVVLGEDPFSAGWDSKLWGNDPPPEEQARQIRHFVEEAVKDGVIFEGQGTVEGKIRVPVLDRDETPNGQRVDLIGYVDLRLPNGVRDYKTTKSSRYVKSSKPGTKSYLGDDLQCLVYGYEWFLENPEADEVYLEHLTFVKETGGRKNPNCVVPKDRVLGHWEQEVRGTALQMLEIREAEKWEDIPDPEDSGACFAFGGCERREICAGVCTQEEYRRNKEKLWDRDWTTDPSSQRIHSSETNDQEKKMGSLSDRVAARRNAGSPKSFSGKWAKPADAAGIDQPPAPPEPEKEVPSQPGNVTELFPKKPGKPAKSFDLFINVLFSQTVGRGEVVDLNQIHYRLAKALEEKTGKAYYEMDAFKRRDLIASAARGPAIQEQLRGMTIVVLDPGPDLKALVEALKPLANTVAEGCR